MTYGEKVQHLRNELFNQLYLLTNWNTIHINTEPEQVRKNIETIFTCAEKLESIR